ncbi:MAG: peptidoglycan DD-metalloendopeptidase family protein [Alkalilacustris sp.]
MSRPALPRSLPLMGAAVLALAACGDGAFDWDMRPSNAGSTADAARQITGQRPTPDSRGVISYPGFQVAVARSGERVSDVAARLDISAEDLARRNAVNPDTRLREGEVLTLPERVAAAPGSRDVGAIATTALDRIDDAQPARVSPPATGQQPLQHTVTRGETAFTIARLYNVTPRALADWNGLGADMAVREGQVLMIPLATPAAQPERVAAAPPPPAPGTGSPTPTPPTAARPLPQDDVAARPAPPPPPSPAMAEERTPTPAAAGSTRLAMPLQGRIIREFQPGRTDGISIAADGGSPVRAAADGTVATITRDTGGTQIVILRHEGNLLTVYANIDDIAVERGQQVSRGARLGALQQGDQPFLLFQVRQGIESVDPMRFLD